MKNRKPPAKEFTDPPEWLLHYDSLDRLLTPAGLVVLGKEYEICICPRKNTYD